MIDILIQFRTKISFITLNYLNLIQEILYLLLSEKRTWIELNSLYGVFTLKYISI